MRIAALQYANGQVKQCDGSIEASHCFCRKFRAIIMCTKFIIQHGRIVKMQSCLYKATANLERIADSEMNAHTIFEARDIIISALSCFVRNVQCYSPVKTKHQE